MVDLGSVLMSADADPPPRPEDSIVEGDGYELRKALGAEGARTLASLMRQPEIRAACLAYLSDLGCRSPANLIVLFAVQKLLAATGGFLGVSAFSRIEAALLKIGPAKKLLGLILSLDKQIGNRERLKDAMLARIRTSELLSPVDEASPFEVLSALYHDAQIQGLDRKVSALFRELKDDTSALLAARDAAGAEPRLDWPLLHGPTSSDRAIDALVYTSQRYGFVGRDAELDLLQRFAGDLSSSGPLGRFSWLLLKGPAGEGKSRLALEFANRLASQGWHAGRMSIDELERFDARGWFPRRPTLIVVDYPALAPQLVRRLLADLRSGSEFFDWPARVLLLERSDKGQWFRQVFSGDADAAAIGRHVFRHEGNPLLDGLLLPPLGGESIAELMAARFEAEGRPVPPANVLVGAAFLIDPRRNAGGEPAPRALFAATAAEFMLAMDQDQVDGPLSFNRNEVLASILNRDRATRWLPAARNDEQRLGLHETLYALATFVLGLSLEDVRAAAAGASAYLPDFVPKGRMPLDRGLMQAMAGSADKILPLEPDLLGEYFVLERLRALQSEEGAVAREAICNAAFDLGGDRAAVFCLRVSADFGRAQDLALFMPTDAVSLKGAEAFAAVCMDLAAGVLVDEEQEPQLDLMLDRLGKLRAAHVPTGKLEFCHATALSNAIGSAARDGRLARVKALLRQTQALHEERPTNVSAAYYAVALANSTVASKSIDHLLTMHKEVSRLRKSFPDDSRVAEYITRAHKNSVDGLIRGARWKEVGQCLRDLDEMWIQFPESDGVVFQAALALANAALSLGSARKWKLAEQATSLLQKLEMKNVHLPDVATRLAEVAASLVAYYHHGGQPDKIDEMVRILSDLRTRHQDNEQLSGREAVGLRNAFNQALEEGNPIRICQFLLMLGLNTYSLRADEAVAIEAAKAFCTALEDSSAEGKWRRVERLQSHLDVLASLQIENIEVMQIIGGSQAYVFRIATAAEAWKAAGQAYQRLDYIAGKRPESKRLQGHLAGCQVILYLFSRSRAERVERERTEQVVELARRRLAMAVAVGGDEFLELCVGVIRDAAKEHPDSDFLIRSEQEMKEFLGDFGLKVSGQRAMAAWKTARRGPSRRLNEEASIASGPRVTSMKKPF